MNNNIRLPKTKVGYKSFYKIIDVAKVLFRIKGVSLTSINEIIEQSGVATGTFYNYFDDKLAVYEYLLNDYSKRISNKINEAIKMAKTREDEERLGIKAFLKFARDDKLSYRIIWESLFINKDLFIEYYTSFADIYAKRLKRSVNVGDVKDDLDLNTLAFMLMGISNFVGLHIVFKGDVTDEEIDEITETIMKVLKSGMFNL